MANLGLPISILEGELATGFALSKSSTEVRTAIDILKNVARVEEENKTYWGAQSNTGFHGTVPPRQMQDAFSAETVEIQVDNTGKLWVNIDGRCALRIGHCRIVECNNPIRGKEIVYEAKQEK